MKKVFIAAALAAMIVSCGSKGNKSGISPILLTGNPSTT